MFNIALRIALLSFLTTALFACSMNTRVSYHDAEGKIPKDVLRKIKRKKTDKSWVLAHLGEPFAIERVETDEQNPQRLLDVYTFLFSKEVAQSGHVLYLLRAGGIEESTEYFHVAFENNKVKKSWVDRFPRPQIGTRIKQAKVTTRRVPAGKTKVTSQSRGDKSNWKIPILKKWLGSGEAQETLVVDNISTEEASEVTSAASSMESSSISESSEAQ